MREKIKAYFPFLRGFWFCIKKRIFIIVLLIILRIVCKYLHIEDIWNGILGSIISVIFIDCIIDTDKNIEKQKVVNIVIPQLNRILTSIERFIAMQYQCVSDKQQWVFKNEDKCINLICERLNLDTIVPNIIPQMTRRYYMYNFSNKILCDLDWILDRYMLFLSSDMIININNLRRIKFFELFADSLVCFNLKDLKWWGFQKEYHDLLSQVDKLQSKIQSF